jgi:hypothetical protein
VRWPGACTDAWHLEPCIPTACCTSLRPADQISSSSLLLPRLPDRNAGCHPGTLEEPCRRRRRGQAPLPPWAANRWVGHAGAASVGRSSKRSACPKKHFRRVFFLRKFYRRPVSFNVPIAPAFEMPRRPGHAPKCSTVAIAPQENLILPQDKLAQKRVAFGLPQELSGELMFETCVCCMSSLSAFRAPVFRLERAPSDQCAAFECTASN